jgi:hypothetical protein
VNYIDQTGLVGKVGGIDLRGRHLNAVGFEHYLSRAHDPHLHTHLVVANSVELENGVDRAVDLRHLERLGPVLELLYRSELRHHLAERGQELSGPPLGTLVLKGMPQGLIEEFSQRRREVNRAAVPFGSSSRSRQVAALRTRLAKAPVDLSELRVTWSERALRFEDRPLERSTSQLYELGVEIMRSGGIFVAPIASPFHAEVAYRIVAEPYRELPELLDVATNSLARRQRRKPFETPELKLSGDLSEAMPLGRSLGVDSGRDREMTGLRTRRLLARTEKERELYRALGLSSDGPATYGGKGVVEMASLDRLPSSYVATLQHSGRLGALESVDDPVQRFRLRWRDSLQEGSSVSIAVELEDGSQLKIQREPEGVLSEAKRALRSQLETNLFALGHRTPVDLYSSVLFEHRELGRMVAEQLIEGDHHPFVQLGRYRYLSGEIVTASKAAVDDRFVLVSTGAGCDHGCVLYPLRDGALVDGRSPISPVSLGFLRGVSYGVDSSVAQLLSDRRDLRPVVGIAQGDRHSLVIPRKALGLSHTVEAFDSVAEFLHGTALTRSVIVDVESGLRNAWKERLERGDRALEHTSPEVLSELRQRAVLAREVTSLYVRCQEWKRSLGHDRGRDLHDLEDLSLARGGDRETFAREWDR